MVDAMDTRARDVVVVGGGPAGLSAALMLGRARRRVLVIDSGQPRNRFASHMHGVLGNEGVPPSDLIARGRAEAASYGVEFLEGAVETVRPIGRGVVVVTDDSAEIPARALIVASGMTDVLPDIPGLAEHWGTKVLHCPYCHGWEVRDRRIGVLTTSPLGIHHAELLRQWTDDLTVFTAGLGGLSEAAERRLLAREITLVPGEVREVAEGSGALVVRTDDEAVELDAIFTMGTPHTHEGFLEQLRLVRDETPFGSYLAVDQTGRTSDGRVWAVGNVVNPMLNVPMSIGAGAQVGGAVNGALVTEDFDSAVATGTEWPLVASDGFWEQRYAGATSTWSGRPNQTLVDVVSGLTPGRALDVGCGEGGDVIWLAHQGWQATGIDVAPTAIARAEAAAHAAGLPSDQAGFVAADGSSWSIMDEFDLVVTSFLHGSSGGSRQQIMRRAAEVVAPGGHLLVISHAPMPWSGEASGDRHSHGSHFLSPAEEVEALDLDPDAWTTRIAGSRTRQSLGPDGGVFDIDDTVVLLQRT